MQHAACVRMGILAMYSSALHELHGSATVLRIAAYFCMVSNSIFQAGPLPGPSTVFDMPCWEGVREGAKITSCREEMKDHVSRLPRLYKHSTYLDSTIDAGRCAESYLSICLAQRVMQSKQCMDQGCKVAYRSQKVDACAYFAAKQLVWGSTDDSNLALGQGSLSISSQLECQRTSEAVCQASGLLHGVAEWF